MQEKKTTFSVVRHECCQSPPDIMSAKVLRRYLFGIFSCPRDRRQRLAVHSTRLVSSKYAQVMIGFTGLESH